mmetsp:Transcript_47795/g.79295  ORF Transcript_47795/g.79295 Transcript_47795/m.79295 type:complete len:200 (+) Transcript_47795:48-647(+)|eukprot:CAMPEP_0202690434 /NCGR_PEP_ID=MMETSP1385-20130828/5418_1 /ASSEMBLY_ACC=CAM_ASM_000861 /TAXON_ID=933848 /ORGANISM="Elphidium margaritaceum" /LENGTH=199 /DNA_ID=CAMNT_0049345697 /DNA_START=48 /DNA_END=647 /DNA_ORIENTATION=-
MPKATTCKQAIEAWKKRTGEDPGTAKVVKIHCQIPSIDKMDSVTLGQLAQCEQLSLSTNQIDKIAPLPGCKNLKILSLGRNKIKKIEKLDDIADTLEELWVSYNIIEKLSGLENLTKLRVLYMSNNQIKSFDELERIAHISSLKDVLFYGNPIQSSASDEQSYRCEVIRRLPLLTNWKLDGRIVSKEEVNRAAEQKEDE